MQAEALLDMLNDQGYRVSVIGPNVLAIDQRGRPPLGEEILRSLLRLTPAIQQVIRVQDEAIQGLTDLSKKKEQQ